MLDIKETIDKLSASLQDIVKEYESLDDISPFTKEAFVSIKNIITSLHQLSSLTLDALITQITSLKNQKDLLVNEYERNGNNLNDNLQIRLRAISNKYEGYINNLNKEINKSKQEHILDNEQAEQDITFFNASSEQQSEINDQAYKDESNKFQYQYNMAKESYLDNIIYYNDILSGLLLNEEAEFNNSLTKYDSETEGLIEGYNNIIAHQTNLLERLNKAYKEKLSDFKVIKRNETEDLNNKIRSLNDSKDKQIEEIKNKYLQIEENMNKNQEHDNLDNTTRNQNIIKEFVYNMDQLDLLLNNQKASYTRLLNDEHEQYYENLFRLHKSQEKEIINLSSLHLSEKDQKARVRKINKDYLDQANECERIHKNSINRIENDYALAVENNAYEKKKLDINRTSQIKSLNLEEIRNNKHYQEQNNRYENEMSFEINNANFKYNINANSLRLASSIRLLNLEREIQTLEANHQKDVRKINNIIRNTKAEIEYAKESNRLIHQFELDKYTKKRNYLTVTNLLEIEKCKVLDEYNHKSYELKVLNARLFLNYGIERLKLKNERNEVLTKNKIKIEDKRLENLITTTGFSIHELSIQEGKEYALEKQKKVYGVDVLSHNVLVNRFKLNIKSLNQALSAFILLVNRLEEHVDLIISYVLTKLDINPTNYHIVESFTSRLAKESLNYHTELIRLYDNISTGIINNHLKFEEEFKFKTVIDQLKEKYDADLGFINGEIDRLTTSIKDSEAKIDNITSRISRLELTNSFSSERRRSLRQNRSKATIRKNKKTIKRLFLLVRKSELENEQDKKRIKGLRGKLELIHERYQSDMNQIRRLQYNSAQAYHVLKDSIKEVTSGMINALLEQKSKTSSFKLSKEDYAEAILRAENEFVIFNDNEIKRLYTIIHTFTIENDHNLNASLAKINAENNISIKKIHQAANTKIANAKETFSKTDYTQKLDIEQLKLDSQALMHEFDSKEQHSKQGYNNSLNNISNSNYDNEEKFFTELYAIVDNQADIEHGYNKAIIELKRKFELDKEELLNNMLANKEEFKQKLYRYIEARNLIIKNLPYDLKEKKSQATLENKAKTSEIELEINENKNLINQKRRNSKKILAQIDSTFQGNIQAVDVERKKLLSKEKMKHSSATKKLR